MIRLVKCFLLALSACYIYILFILHDSGSMTTDDVRGGGEDNHIIGVQQLFRAKETISSTDNQKKVLSDEERKRLRHEKKEVLQILRRVMGIDHEKVLTDLILQQLPRWKDITAVYGKRPVILGANECNTFRNNSDPLKRYIAPVGLFNSGTDLLDELLHRNCQLLFDDSMHSRSRYLLSWGKRTTLRFNLRSVSNQTNNETIHMLPVVTVRDPPRWFESICHHPHGRTRFDHASNHPCPILQQDEGSNGAINPEVKVQYANSFRQFPSLLEFWSWWTGPYIWKEEFNQPRLVIRYEDLIFFTKEVVETVCQCAGGKLVSRRSGDSTSNKTEDFQYITSSVTKKLGPDGMSMAQANRSNFLEAIIKQGKVHERFRMIRSQDMEKVKTELSKKWLQQLHYPPPPAAQSQFARSWW